MAWKYFSKDEMKCKCCGECHMDEHFMDMIDSLRQGVGRPLVVSSGYRCEKHDDEEAARAKKPPSRNHTRGQAVDLECLTSDKRYAIIKVAVELKFKRIGIGKTFIHLDLISDHPQQVIWLY